MGENIVTKRIKEWTKELKKGILASNYYHFTPHKTP